MQMIKEWQPQDLKPYPPLSVLVEKNINVGIIQNWDLNTILNTGNVI
jgi:hypothetical protein